PLEGDKPDYPEIEALTRDIPKRSGEKIEPQKPRAPEPEKPAPRAAPATVVITSPKASAEKDDKIDPALQTVRSRIAALLDQDIDQCLAEIEILPPALANDS